MLHYQSSRVWQTRARRVRRTLESTQCSPCNCTQLYLCPWLTIPPFCSCSSFVNRACQLRQSLPGCLNRSANRTGDYYLIRSVGKGWRARSFNICEAIRIAVSKSCNYYLDFHLPRLNYRLLVIKTPFWARA